MRYFVCIVCFFFSFTVFSQKWLQLGADIDGDQTGGAGGHSVSLSDDGTIVAIGEPYNKGSDFLNSEGLVRVYKYENNTWNQLGQNITGTNTSFDMNGYSLSLSSNGTILAVGASGKDANKGAVRVYQYTNNTWTKLGADIDGESGDQSGTSVSLSADGSIVAIGAPEHGGNNQIDGPGTVRIYKFENNTWTKLGSDIDGESGDMSGSSVSLSSDGTIVAIGAIWNDGNTGSVFDNRGHVRIYKWDGTNWVQRGNDIDGEAAYDKTGYSVSLSSDGTIVAIGAPENDGNGSQSGHVRVYQYTNNTWAQLGSDIDGEAAGDESGSSVSLSDDGTIVAVSAFKNTGDGGPPAPSGQGHIRVFNWNGSAWSQIGNDINGNDGDEMGRSISISSDGTKVAGGATKKNAGLARVYQYRDPHVTLSSSNLLPEVAGETATVTATLEFASSSDVQVTLAATGTATGGGTDYTLSSNTITIAAGQTTGTATLTVVADQTADDNETIILDISGVTNAIEATAQQVTITITEDVCTASGGSNLTGVIDSDKKLYKACSPYTVTGNLWIKSGATLTVDNGVTINVNDSKYIKVDGDLIVKPGATLNFGSAAYLDVNDGKLDAQGTVSDSVTFTLGSKMILKNNSLIKYAIISGGTSSNGNTNQSGIILYNSEVSYSRIFDGYSIWLNNQSSIRYNNIYNMREEIWTNKSINTILGNLIHDKATDFCTNCQHSYIILGGGGNIIKYNRMYESNPTTLDLNAININNSSGTNPIIENNIIGSINNVRQGKIGIIFDYGANDLTSIKNNQIGGYDVNLQIDRPSPIFKHNSFIGEMNLASGDRNILVNPNGFSQSEVAIDMKENYWGNVAASDINNSITDYEDDFQLKGNVDYSNALTSPHPATPISSVKNLKITRLASSTSLTWDANTETDLAGYKLHYGALTNGSYATVLDLGNVTSKTLNVGLGVTDGITLTAYDADADGTDDQIEGHESWFAEAEVISAPIGVNDSYQIAAGSTIDMTNGPFAHYQFDGDIKDVSGNGYDLINLSNVPNIIPPTFVNDRFDKEKKALKFSGGSTIIEYPHNDAFNFKGQNEWSIYFWMKLDVKTNNGVFTTYENGILSKYGAAKGWAFYHRVAVRSGYPDEMESILNFQIDGSSNTMLRKTYDFSDGKTKTQWANHTPIWRQVAVTYNGSEVSMYFDGAKVDSYFGAIPDMTNNYDLDIGRYDGLALGGGMYGNLDDIRFYNRSLTALEIQEMYDAVIDQSFNGVLDNDIDLDGDTLTTFLVQTTPNGTLTLQDNGKFKYVPNANYSGVDNFIYKAYDGTYSSANTTASISVSTPPTAANDSYSLNEGAALTVDAAAGVLANDTDAESDALTAVKLTNPINGTLTFNANGSFTYTHDGGGSTSDSFTYKANDGIGNSNTATVTFTIAASDDAPVATKDSYGTEENEILVISSNEGVLANDSDEEGDAMTAVLVTDVQLGTLDLSSDGGFTYQPPLNQKGIDTFEYKVKAGDLFSNTTYATININRRPVIAANQVYSVNENKANGSAIGQISITDESTTFTWEILSGNVDNVFSIDSNNGIIKVNNSSALNYEQIQKVTLSVRANDGSMWSDPVDLVININNVQDMAIVSSKIEHSYCSSGTGTGSITLVVEGQEGNLDVSWSSGQTTLSISGLASGTYTVTLSDAVGQNIVENYTINQLPIFQNTAVCYVSSDSLDYTKNRIFVKTGDDFYNIDKYKIWREGSTTGSYDLIGEINAETDDNYLDTISDNRSRSYKYRVSMVDKCGVEANQSTEHTTHHLVANQGISGEINLNWSKYLGLDFGTYEIFRKKDNSPFEKIGAVGSDVLSFSDFNVSDQSSYKYYVAVVADVECRPEGGGGINIYQGDDNNVFGIGQGGKKKRSLRSNTFELAAVNNTPPSIGDQTFSIQEKSTNGSSVGTIVAIDADNDLLTFTITGGSGESTFAVEETTGKLTVKDNTELDLSKNTSLKLTVKVSDGSSDASAEMTINITDKVLAIEEVASQIFNVYPIPAQRKLKVVLKDNVEVKRIEFIDYSGKLIAPKNSKRKENTLTLDVSNLYSGIYILNLVTEKGTSKARVTIER